jgi:hypothetical protein
MSVYQKLDFSLPPPLLTCATTETLDSRDPLILYEETESEKNGGHESRGYPNALGADKFLAVSETR